MSTVEIRHYDSMGAYQQDAATMAAAGWRVIAQSSGSRISGAGTACIVLGIIAALGGFLFGFELFIVAAVLMLIGLVSRETTYTVTYQPTIATESPVLAWGAQTQAAAGSRCGRCGKTLSPVWRGRCEHCKASYAEFPPVPAG